jgi:hypothetical protein
VDQEGAMRCGGAGGARNWRGEAAVSLVPDWQASGHIPHHSNFGLCTHAPMCGNMFCIVDGSRVI